MTSSIQPYLFFGGRCDDAIEFYRRVLGAEVEILMRYEESPTPQPQGMLPPGFEKKVMHATIRIGETSVMMSDGCEVGATFRGFSLHLALPSEGDADRVFGELSEGGTVQMPLAQTFWSKRFGLVTDRFGIGWMISVPT